MRKFGPVIVAAAALGVALVVMACSSKESRSGFNAAGAGAEADDGGTPGMGFADGGVGCQGLGCKVVSCSTPGTTTTITGKVYDPAAVNALYNVQVYIPGGLDADPALPPLTQGVSCDTCASVVLSPLVATLTNTKGEFTLANVPVATGVPIVVQIGKWRRKFTFDVTNSCGENPVPDKTFTLPKNGTEGDMPQIAVTTGDYDALQCLLYGMGIDQAEFVPGAGPTGHVHVFNGYNSTPAKNFAGAPSAGGSSADPMGGELWNNLEKLKPYDIVLMSCEGAENLDNKGGAINAPGARQAMFDYTQLGGKVFATHFHYAWFRYSPDPKFQALANWNIGFGGGGVGNTYDVDQSFPKGMALAEWLVAVGASTTQGKIDLQGVTNSVSSVNPPSQSWIEQGAKKVSYFSVNTPIGVDPTLQCGRAVYGDLHLLSTVPTSPFPAGCPAPGKLLAQQTALEFLFFDLSGCVQSDSTPPSPPK